VGDEIFFKKAEDIDDGCVLLVDCEVPSPINLVIKVLISISTAFSLIPTNHTKKDNIMGN
jgi:hypothetical protein